MSGKVLSSYCLSPQWWSLFPNFFFLPLHWRAEYSCKLIWAPRKDLLLWLSSMWYLLQVFDPQVLHAVMFPWHCGFCLCVCKTLHHGISRFWKYTEASRPIHTVLFARLSLHVGTACTSVWDQSCSWPLLSPQYAPLVGEGLLITYKACTARIVSHEGWYCGTFSRLLLNNPQFHNASILNQLLQKLGTAEKVSCSKKGEKNINSKHLSKFSPSGSDLPEGKGCQEAVSKASLKLRWTSATHLREDYHQANHHWRRLLGLLSMVSPS